ncbi:MAG: hypothetical protein LBU84_07485 [Prevotella sp.]|nr:hypothetical protein [Prevotella sp.]
MVFFNPNIPVGNNAFGRCTRPLKLKQKVSDGFRPDNAVVHPITGTAKKNQQSPFLALMAIALNT